MKKYLATLIASLFFLGFAAPSYSADFSAAYRVNSTVITNYEIEQMSLMLQATGASSDSAHSKAVEFLINDRLIRKEAARIGLDVDSNTIASTLDTMAGGAGKGPDLKAEFISRGIDSSTVDTYVSSQILKRTYAEIRGKSNNVTAEERIQNIQSIPDQITKTVSVSEIVIPYAEYGGRIPARYQRKLIMERYRSGESFAQLAREFSRSETGKNGGAIPEIPLEGLNPQLTSIISGLNPGAIGRPIETEGAIILIRLNGYGENRRSLPRDPLVSYIDLFINNSNGLKASSQEADNLLAEVRTCKHAKAKIGVLPNSNFYEDIPVSTLSSGVALALARMETGTSAKFERETGTSVLYLCDRQIKVPEELQQAVNSRAVNESLESQMDGLLRDLRASAKIVKLQ